MGEKVDRRGIEVGGEDEKDRKGKEVSGENEEKRGIEVGGENEEDRRGKEVGQRQRKENYDVVASLPSVTVELPATHIMTLVFQFTIILRGGRETRQEEEEEE